ncbi:MAG: hypothetical protein IKY51_01815 [Alistipes sp.]|nr:hypothetical protein [Alistipes sp.]
MKKIFCAIIVAMSVASCGKVANSMYFDASDNRVYDDATAEFDTLSYAVGMNLGLGLRYQPAGMTFDYEVLMEAMTEELANGALDYESLAENKELIKRFSTERLQPFTIAQQRSKSQSKSANTLKANLFPTPFNEEFTEESVSRMFGRDMASYLVTAAYPLNMHWLRCAIDEASKAEGEIVHDSLMRLTVLQMRGSLQKYHTSIHPEYIVETAREWLDNVAAQPSVHPMVVEDEDTLYYRVNRAGNGIKPRSLNDTVSFSYDLYTRSGKLIESHSQRANIVREALEKEKAGDTLDNPKVKARIQQLSDQLDDIENLRVPVSKALLKGLQYGIQNVGEGGEITIWMPASLAFGERGNRVVHGNDAVVMNVALKSVSYGPTEEELAALEEETSAMPKMSKKRLENGIFAPKQAPEEGETPQNKIVIKPTITK